MGDVRGVQLLDYPDKGTPTIPNHSRQIASAKKPSTVPGPGPVRTAWKPRISWWNHGPARNPNSQDPTRLNQYQPISTTKSDILRDILTLFMDIPL